MLPPSGHVDVIVTVMLFPIRCKVGSKSGGLQNLQPVIHDVPSKEETGRVGHVVRNESNTQSTYKWGYIVISGWKQTLTIVIMSPL